MRAAIAWAAAAFLAVLVIAGWLRPSEPGAATPTPSPAGVAVTCKVAGPDCQALADKLAEVARAANPGRILVSLTILPDGFEACFSDGLCYGAAQAGGGGVAVTPAPLPPEAAPTP